MFRFQELRLCNGIFDENFLGDFVKSHLKVNVSIYFMYKIENINKQQKLRKNNAYALQAVQQKGFKSLFKSFSQFT